MIELHLRVFPQLQRLPFTLEFIRTLDEPEFSLITEWRTDAGESVVRYWCESEAQIERYALLPVAQSQIYSLFEKQSPLITLFENTRLGVAFVVDEAAAEEQRFYICRADEIPPPYLPEVVATLTGDLPRVSNVQEFYLGESAEQNIVQTTAKNYQELQTFQGLFGPGGDPRGISINEDLTGGYAFGGLYSKMKKVHGDDNARVQGYAVASPGYLRMKCDDRLRSLVQSSLAQRVNYRSEINRLYKKLGSWSNNHDDCPSEEEVTTMYVRVCELLMVDDSSLRQSCSDLRNAVQTVRSYANRLKQLDQLRTTDQASILGRNY